MLSIFWDIAVCLVIEWRYPKVHWKRILECISRNSWLSSLYPGRQSWLESQHREEQNCLKETVFHRPRIVFGIYPVWLKQVVYCSYDFILVIYCYIDFIFHCIINFMQVINSVCCENVRFRITILRQIFSVSVFTVNRFFLWFSLRNYIYTCFVLTFVAGQDYLDWNLVLFITKRKKKLVF